MLTQCYTARPLQRQFPEIAPDFTKPASRPLFHAQMEAENECPAPLPRARCDTSKFSKASKFARTCAILLAELDDTRHHTGITQGERTHMARHTKMKIAALATTLVATMGLVAASPAMSSDAGKAPAPSYRSIDCC